MEPCSFLHASVEHANEHARFTIDFLQPTSSSRPPAPPEHGEQHDGHRARSSDNQPNKQRARQRSHARNRDCVLEPRDHGPRARPRQQRQHAQRPDEQGQHGDREAKRHDLAALRAHPQHAQQARHDPRPMQNRVVSCAALHVALQPTTQRECHRRVARGVSRRVARGVSRGVVRGVSIGVARQHTGRTTDAIATITAAIVRPGLDLVVQSALRVGGLRQSVPRPRPEHAGMRALCKRVASWTRCRAYWPCCCRVTERIRAIMLRHPLHRCRCAITCGQHNFFRASMLRNLSHMCRCAISRG